MFSRSSKNRPRGRTLSRDVSDELIRRIVSGQYEIGAKMPTERLLSIEFGVNRHAVREALKRLEALGLVTIKHGSGIYVECVQFTAGVELFETMLVDKDGNINADFLRDALEFRRDMVQTITRLSVKRRKARELGKICRLIDDLCFILGRNEFSEEEAIVLSLLEAMAQATHNTVYILVTNTLKRLFQKIRITLDTPLYSGDDAKEKLMKLRDAFEFSNVEAAEEVVSNYLATIEEIATALPEMKGASEETSI